jgi:multidrug efflux pump subunit AcrA (membrane-fusion protein)
MRITAIPGMLLVVLSAIVSAEEKLPDGAIEVRDVFLRIKESAEIPALERGQLKRILSEPGDSVDPLQLLAELDDVEAKLNLELAQIDFEIAELQHHKSVSVQIARSTLDETQELLNQARLEAEASKAIAATDIGIRQATMDIEVSKGDLERAVGARKEFTSSISDQQLIKLTLVRDHDLLKLEKAKLDQSVEMIKSQSRNAIIAQQEAAVQRLEHALNKAESEREAEKLSLKGLQKQVEITSERLERRKLKAPFPGMVVEQLKNPGEWIEIGESVLRIVRMDVLFVEGYVNANLVTSASRGKKVIVDCGSQADKKLEGTLVFVSPEIDSVSQQVLVKAVIENEDLHLRPGQPAQMWIDPR